VTPRRPTALDETDDDPFAHSLFGWKSAWPRVSITTHIGMSSVVVTCYSPPLE
jgi:hypothetical protein